MNSLKTLSVWTAFTMSNVSAAEKGAKTDYSVNGANWPQTHPDCGLSNQSPIDLSARADAPYPRISSSDDRFTKEYNNQYEEVPVTWTGDTTLVALEDGPNGFTSNLAFNSFGAVK